MAGGAAAAPAGTPIQNDLLELHALFDLVCPGLLGERAAFRAHFERPITAGSDKARRRVPEAAAEPRAPPRAHQRRPDGPTAPRSTRRRTRRASAPAAPRSCARASRPFSCAARRPLCCPRQPGAPSATTAACSCPVQAAGGRPACSVVVALRCRVGCPNPYHTHRVQG